MFISSTDKLKLLSSSGQGDTSSCQSLLCKPQNTDWPLTPSKGVRSLLLTPLHNGDTKVQLRPPCFFLKIFQLRYVSLCQVIYLVQLHLWLYTSHNCRKSVPWPVKQAVFAVPAKSTDSYIISLCCPLADIILKRTEIELDCLASLRELWKMCIKINLSTTLALSGFYLGYSTI